MNTNQIPFLEYTAYAMRRWAIRMTTKAGSGHATSALSAADIIAVLFFHTMHFDPKDTKNPNNDRFILSKGHAAPILYAAWHELGIFTDEELLTYRQFDSVLEGHPTFRFEQAEAATGSLGIGLSIGTGQALCAKQDDRTYRTYVLMGDSEISEGSIWEAAQLASFYLLNNLIGVIDCNRLGQSTPTMSALEGNEAQRFAKMFDAFGWHTIIVDGHDVSALIEAFDNAHKQTEKPVVIIANTKKGYGIELFEDKDGFHGKALSEKDSEIALMQLQERFSDAALYEIKEKWKPQLPKGPKKDKSCSVSQIILPAHEYQKEESIPTRKAYGEALKAVGSVCHDVVVLDAEVKNSTYADIFEAAYPDRFYQCFIAEQNMIGMGIGFEKRGKLPFISTFGAFLTRAHDQIRMAAIGNAALRIVGSHAGVSIGEDGPSQMALEDIAMMRSIPNSVVLYPADAVCTYALVQQMARYQEGISYLRTTRMATPVLYDAKDTFEIGGCKIVRSSKHDQLCLLGAGVTLFEALKAHDILKERGISVRVIDLYCVKPLPIKSIRAAVLQSGSKIITVEDHYVQGGIGEAVSAALCNDNVVIKTLAVSHFSRSGKPAELLADAGIDAAAIVKAAEVLCK